MIFGYKQNILLKLITLEMESLFKHDFIFFNAKYDHTMIIYLTGFAKKHKYNLVFAQILHFEENLNPVII